jgi:hypothetical protein
MIGGCDTTKRTKEIHMAIWHLNTGAREKYFKNTCPPSINDSNPNLGSSTRSSRIRWYPSDSEENYVKEGNLYSIEDVDYDLNAQGFRCDEFDNIITSKNKKLMVFGCSNTFGTGLPENHIWHFHVKHELEKKYNEPIDLINLGMPGSGSEDIIRLISMMGDTFQPDYICCLLPPVFRKTLIDENGRLFNYLVSNKYDKRYHDKVWTRINNIAEQLVTLAPQNFYYSEYLAMSLVETYAKLNNAKFKIIKIDKVVDNITQPGFENADRILKTKARDSAHSGIYFHEYVGKLFIEGLFNE